MNQELEFTVADMARCSSALRKDDREASTMTEAAEKIVRFLYDYSRDPQDGSPSFALVRLFKTHAYGKLPESSRRFVRQLTNSDAPDPATKCLTLLATTGDRKEWQSVHLSAGHQAIPLLSPQAVLNIPMIANLVKQLGLEVDQVLTPDPTLIADLSQTTFNVFHVPVALGSRLIPSQEHFVIPERIRSVLGFGGMFSTGDLFAVIIFSRASISSETAKLFQSLSLSVKTALLRFTKQVFSPDPGDVPDNGEWSGRAVTLEELLAVQERLVIDQTERLQNALANLARARDELELRVQDRTVELVAANEALRKEVAERERAQGDREKMFRELLDVSWRVGRADVATHVLHNVGNVLNSVNVSVGLVLDTLRHLPIEDLHRIFDKLGQHQNHLSEYLAADPKGMRLLPYLEKLVEHLAIERKHGIEELDSLGSQLDHVKHIISLQQDLACAAGLREPVSLSDLLEQALAINLISLERQSIEIERNYEYRGQVLLDRHGAVQILVNLISNAKQAMAEQTGVRKLTLTIRIPQDRLDVVRVEVGDTGLGIEPAHLTRIFTQGFTTKHDGHGFGLHSGALSAKGMGGHLRAASPGAGMGATFTLDLPVGAEALPHE